MSHTRSLLRALARRTALSVPAPAGSRRCAVILGAAVAAMGLGLGAFESDALAQVPSKNRVQGSNGDGLDDHLFRPALDSKGFFSVNGADILGHLDFSLGLIMDYGYG